MLPLQEFIHKFEEGEGLKTVKLAAFFLAMLALATIYNLREYRNLSTPEAMDMAQLARNLSEGKGFTTDFVRPLSLFLLQQKQGTNINFLKSAVPDLSNPPVYPLMLAGLMKVLPFNWEISQASQLNRHQPDFLISLFNQLWFALGIGLVFKVAKKLFDTSVAWFSAVLYACSDLFWRFSMSGLPTLFLVVIFLAIVWCLFRLEQGTREEQHSATWFGAWSAALGLLIGLAAMTQYAYTWLLLPTVIFLAFFTGQNRTVTLPLTIIICLLVMTPWLARNYNLSGNFFGTAGYALDQGTSSFQGATLERAIRLEPAIIESIPTDDYFRKFFVNASHIFQTDLPKMGGNWLAAFFLAGLLMPFKSLALSRLRYFLLMSLALFVVVQAMGQTWVSEDASEARSENFLAVFSPLVLIFGAGLFFILVDHLNLPFLWARSWITAFAGVVLCAPLIFTLLPPRSYPICYPPYYPWLIQRTSYFLNPNELMMSDMPWAVAWYGRRQCLWLTMNVKPDFFAINDFQRPVKGLYFTHITLDEHFLTRMVKGDDRAWGRFILESLIKGNVPPGFPLRNAWSDVLPDQIFLSDWERWRGGGK